MSLENKLLMVMDRETHKMNEKFIANYPNIRSLQGFLKGQWDLSLFDECFKGSNRLGDVDASIELNGHTLLVEFKESTRSMTKGQTLKAIRQAKYSNIVTIFVFGSRNNPEGFLQITPSPNENGYISCGYIEGDIDRVREQISEWAKHTEENVLVSSKTEEWKEVGKVLTEMYS